MSHAPYPVEADSEPKPPQMHNQPDPSMQAPMEPPANSQMNYSYPTHIVLKDDLGVDEPQNWPIPKKIAVSLAASGYTFALLYGATAYTTGLTGVVRDFNVSTTKSILPYSLYIWGILFAPLYSPHVSERIGRNRFYFVATLGLGLFTLGAAYSRTYAQLAICRFFAGLLGGSNAVQIEGTFADVWPALFTNSYYPFLACAQYFGAATGAIIGWHVTPSTNWRWTQYTTLMFVLAALFLGMGVPETYRRELVRRKARALKQPSPLAPALSGVGLQEMVRYTLINPLVMFVTEPLVTMITLYMGLNFGVLFAWFILVPVVLQGVAMFTPQQVGSAFGTALGGTFVGALLSIIIDQLVVRLKRRRLADGQMLDIEHRMITCMIGAIMITTSLFWIGWTANANFNPAVPVAGNGIYVAGSVMTLIGFISYLFDAYSPQGTLSALTMAACFRLALAGAIPLLILIAATNIGGNWALGTFGFISVAFLPFPFVIFFFGKRLRTKSRFAMSQEMASWHNGSGSTLKKNVSYEDGQGKRTETA